MKQREKCEGELTEKGVKGAPSKMGKNETQGNDGLIKVFIEMFCLEIKSLLLLSFKKCFLTEELSTSQKQAVIKPFQKKKNKKS